MKIIISHLIRAFFGASIFCILFLELSATALISGAITGVIFSVLSKRIEINRSSFYGIWSIKYYFLLFINMITSTIKLAFLVFSKEAPSVSIKKESSAADATGQVLVSNSITLTPGTLTLEQRDNVYTVIEIKSASESGEIASSFEKNLRKGGVK